MAVQWRIAVGLALLVGAVPALAGGPRVTARAALVIDHGSGKVLYTRHADRRLPPASTTKLLTAYLAIRSGKLDRVFTVSRRASRMPPSKIWLQTGWKFRVLDLVYAILLNSANDASVVLAEGLGGSIHGFARQMNATAKELGASRSHFLNPSGLPARGHYSTARDLTTILRAGLRFPLFRQILSTRTRTIRTRSGSRRRISLRSHNRLLGHARSLRIIGKTGYTRRAKRCFVGVATSGSREVLIAVLGASDLWGDVRRLAEYGIDRGMPGRYQLTEADWQKALRNPDRAPKAGVAAAVSSRRFHVRVASYRKLRQAEGLRHRLEQHGYRQVVVERLLSGWKPLYRVTVRGFTTRQAALRAAKDMGRTYRVTPRIVSIGA